MTAIAETIQIVAHLSESQRAKIFGIFAAILILCMGLYVLNVHKAIMNVVEREAIIKQIHIKSSAVADLESKYFTLENAVNLDLAKQQGFAQAPVSLFIKKSAGTAVLLTRSNEL